MIFSNINQKSNTNFKSSNVKCIMFCIALIMTAFLISACSAFKDAKRYEMKKSPCACFEEYQHIG